MGKVIISKEKKEGIHLKSRAAVAFKPGEPLEIVEIDVEEPRQKRY